MSDPGTESLLKSLAAGREPAFVELYDRFSERLYRAALAMLGRDEDAQDAVQEVFLAMVRSRRKLAGVEDLAAYLFASLRHAAGRLAARRARRPDTPHGAMADAAAQPTWPRRPDPRGERLARALGALPDEQREVVAMKIHGGLTFAQIALAAGIPPNTAASRYRYALAKLRGSLEEPET